MANSNTLQRSINYASILARGAPLSSIFSYANEPALTIGDYVRQFIMGPPFAWRWNRSVTAFNAAIGVSDYALTAWSAGATLAKNVITVDTNGNEQQVTTAGVTGATVPTWASTGNTIDNTVTWTNRGVVGDGTFSAIQPLGWLEKAVAIDAQTVSHELSIVLNLGLEPVQNLPFSISPIFDNANGVYTFRMLPAPEQVYTVILTQQNSPVNFAALSDLWSPIPDYLSYLYNQGTLAKVYEYINHEGYLPEEQLFLRQVIAANSGLTESQVNIFLSERIVTARQGQSAMGESQSGRQARGAF